jgi:RNA polymerase II subunit A-like phosphatase
MKKSVKRARLDKDMEPTPCSHDIIVFGGMCAKCGEQVNIDAKKTNETTTRLTVNGGKNIILTQRGAREDALRNVKTLMGRRKLALVLDLDHTLLHATPDKRVAERGWDKASPDIYTIELREKGTRRPPVHHYIKLRQGVAELLKQCHECYQLYIYTHGTRQYAEAIAKVIDPTQAYFQGRIISRSDNPDGMQHKELSQMFPCDDSMALILDDRMDVWPTNLDNLIKVKPYHYFHNMADVNNASGTSIATASLVGAATGAKAAAGAAAAAANGTAVVGGGGPSVTVPLPTEDDDELSHVMRVLLQVHAEFYQNVVGAATSTTGTSSSSSSSSSSSTSSKRRRDDDNEDENDSMTLEKRALNQVEGRGPNVKNILRNIRHNVFADVHMVFSGIIQKNTMMQTHEHPTWKQAELFGAAISNVVKKGVTHVVAQKPGTDKTMSATKIGVFIVSPLWLQRSISTFQRCSEAQYGFTPLERLRQSQGYPPAGSGVFVAPPKRAAPAIAAPPAAASVSSNLSNSTKDEDMDNGMSFTAWKDKNYNVNQMEEDDDDDDDDDRCIIDHLVGKFF